MSEVINRVGSFPHSNKTSMHEVEQALRQNAPSSLSTSLLEELRAPEYSRLNKHGHICLDSPGGRDKESQLREDMELLRNNVFGNPDAVFHLSQEKLRKIFRKQSNETLPKLIPGVEGMSLSSLSRRPRLAQWWCLLDSLGRASIAATVYPFTQFAHTFKEIIAPETNLAKALHCSVSIQPFL